MILTWLWKMFQWFRQSRDPPPQAPLVETPSATGALGDFVNHSNDAQNSGVVIFKSEPPPEAVAKP
uniref:Uncharacterized protein n=1 Tax=Caulobacter sp. (strain K31) TaxID=366602 RepID=B0T603_CAUSK